MTGGRRAVAAGMTLVFVGTVSGCGPTLADLPRPGGSVSGSTYQVTALFNDALNLPDGAKVRIAGAEVGRVTKIETENYLARVEMKIPTKVVLTDAATAELRLTTPLGEGFIDIVPGKGKKTLTDGAMLGTEVTSTAASVEDMLAAASVFITGGGLGQIRTIAVELQKVIDGPKGNPAKLLRSLNDTLSTLNDRTGDIDTILDGLDTLARTLVDRRATLRAALTDIAPAAKLLADQTDKFSELLTKVADLGRVGDRVVKATRANLISMLKSAQPVLDALISIEDDVGPTLRQLVKFGKFFDDAVPSDYLTGDVEVTEGSFSADPTEKRAPDLTLRQMMGGRR